MKNLFTSLFIFYTTLSLAQTPTINWQKSLGGSSVDQAYGIRQTFDGDYITTGRSQSNNNDVSGNHSADDYWLVKLNPGVLALNLLSFTAQLQQNKTVLLSWSTSNEINNDHFTIEKSKDGINFSDIGMVSASVKPQTRNNFSFTDNSVTTGTWYYRLKQTDKNDQSVYSKTIPVKITSQTQIKIVPNPSATGKFFIDLGEAKKNIYITVTDNGGRNILSQQQSSTQFLNINLRDQKGVYYLLMVFDGGKSIQKLIVE